MTDFILKIFDKVFMWFDKDTCSKCGEPYDLMGFPSTVCQGKVNGKPCGYRNY